MRRVRGAIDEVPSGEGVLVFMDLGSAVLSATMALEFIATKAEVRLSDAPFVEGIIAGIVLAAAGASIDEVAREASGAMTAKRGQLEPLPEAPQEASGDPLSVDEVLINPEGLHTRPAAMFVQTAGRYDALVDVTNLTTGTGPVTAKSMIGLLSLGAKQGHRIKLHGHGPDAATAVSRFGKLADGFGEVTSVSAAT